LLARNFETYSSDDNSPEKQLFIARFSNDSFVPQSTFLVSFVAFETEPSKVFEYKVVIMRCIPSEQTTKDYVTQ
jgi:hypothetical protein